MNQIHHVCTTRSLQNSVLNFFTSMFPETAIILAGGLGPSNAVTSAGVANAQVWWFIQGARQGKSNGCSQLQSASKDKVIKQSSNPTVSYNRSTT
jgi:hypothetical protein